MTHQLIMIYLFYARPPFDERRRPAAGTIKAIHKFAKKKKQQRKWISSKLRPQGFHVPFLRLSHASNTIRLPNRCPSACDLLMNRISVFMFMHVLMVAIDDELMRSFHQTGPAPSTTDRCQFKSFRAWLIDFSKWCGVRYPWSLLANCFLSSCRYMIK